MKLARVVGLVTFVALGPPAGAQDWRAGTGRLEGKVTDAQGQPVASAVVKLELPGRGGTELRTDGKGRWAILGLAGGEWTVELSAPGFTPRRLTVTVSELSRRPALETRLEPAAGPSPEVLVALEKAEASYREGRYAEARREYETLLALRPDLAARIQQQIGFSYVHEKDPARALDHLQLALDAEPDNVPVRAAAVQAAFEAGQPERGRALLAGVAPEGIQDPDIAYNFGVDLLNAGATREAVPWLTRSIDLDPRQVDGYYRRALAHLQLGDVAECRADFERVVERAPGTPQGDLARKALEQVR
jgi:tetratricopeptide (TPR) repeat protein